MRKEKQFLLDEIKDQIEINDSYVLISYKGLKANRLNEFRRNVLKMKGGVEFVKKRLLVKAAGSIGTTLDLKALPGHIGLVFAKEDPLEITKFVYKFRSENDKNVEVVGARIDGQLYDGVQAKALSELPSKDELRAQFLATLEAPLSQTLATMEALVTSVIYCLDNKVKQSETVETNEENN